MTVFRSFLLDGGVDRARVRETIDGILARDEFHRDKSAFAQWLAEKLDKAGRWFADLLGISEPGGARLAFLIFLGLLALVLVWALARTIATRRRMGGAATLENPASVQAANAAGAAALRREARTAAQAGDHIAALRLYFRAIVIGLSERGDLRYRDAWTNRELLERGAPRRDVLPLLSPLVPRLDAQSFGREPAGPEDVARLAHLCDRLLGGPAS